MEHGKPTWHGDPQVVGLQKTSPAPDDSDREQIVERLGWTPKQRLNYLLDMLAFEGRAHRARRLS